jgi:hypothetical protein
LADGDGVTHCVYWLKSYFLPLKSSLQLGNSQFPLLPHLAQLATYSDPLETGENSARNPNAGQNTCEPCNSFRRAAQRPLVCAVLGVLLASVGFFSAGNGSQYLILGDGFRMRAAGACLWGCASICGIARIAIFVEAVSK